MKLAALIAALSIAALLYTASHQLTLEAARAFARP